YPKKTIGPNYVTASGYTEDIPSRTKVGEPQASNELYMYNIEKDTILKLSTENIPGITDSPNYESDYPNKRTTKTEPRPVNFSVLSWSDDGKRCAVVIRSLDFKDCWIMLLNPHSQTLSLLDRQH